MTLKDWMEREQLSDRQMAERMEAWLREHGHDESVHVSAVQKYRLGRVPRGVPRMQAVHAVTCGEVTANGFYALTA